MNRRYGLDCISYLTDINIERVPNKGAVPNTTAPLFEDAQRYRPEQTDLIKAIERKEREIERLRQLLRQQATA
jgi:hypothetical protein